MNIFHILQTDFTPQLGHSTDAFEQGPLHFCNQKVSSTSNKLKASLLMSILGVLISLMESNTVGPLCLWEGILSKLFNILIRIYKVHISFQNLGFWKAKPGAKWFVQTKTGPSQSDPISIAHNHTIKLVKDTCFHADQALKKISPSILFKK